MSAFGEWRDDKSRLCSDSPAPSPGPDCWSFWCVALPLGRCLPPQQESSLLPPSFVKGSIPCPFLRGSEAAFG